MRKFMNALLVALTVMLVAAACSFDDSSAGDLDGRGAASQPSPFAVRVRHWDAGDTLECAALDRIRSM